jgi:hypothetical protein
MGYDQHTIEGDRRVAEKKMPGRPPVVSKESIQRLAKVANVQDMKQDSHFFDDLLGSIDHELRTTGAADNRNILALESIRQASLNF